MLIPRAIMNWAPACSALAALPRPLFRLLALALSSIDYCDIHGMGTVVPMIEIMPVEAKPARLSWSDASIKYKGWHMVT